MFGFVFADSDLWTGHVLVTDHVHVTDRAGLVALASGMRLRRFVSEVAFSSEGVVASSSWVSRRSSRFSPFVQTSWIDGSGSSR